MVSSAVRSDVPSTVELSILRRGHDRNYIAAGEGRTEKPDLRNRASRFFSPLNGVGYFAAALAFPTSATTPSCCIKPRASQLTQPSTILPFVKRAMLIPEMVNCFPVGAIPLRSPL